MLRLKSRSVLCTPSSGLSRALDGLRVGDDVNGASNGGPTEVDDDDDGDDDERDGRIATTRRIERAFASESQGHGWSSANGTNSQGETMTQGGSHGGPDFITPADAQFDAYAGYDGSGWWDARGAHGHFRGARSPCALSPTRNKRPRFGLDVGLSQGTQEFGYASQPLENTQPSQSQGEFGNGFGVPRNREPGGGGGARSGLPRAATSPPCARNAFLPDREQPAEHTAHGRRVNCTSAAQLATMSRFRVDFVDLGCIARGGFSKVHKVIGRLDGCQYALKRTSEQLKNERDRSEALREVHVMASLVTCPQIVRYHSAWWENDHLYIHMELCEEGCASRMVDSRDGERMNDAQLARCLRDISTALAFAHDRGLAHMDVKPDNIFICKEGFKLGDWGRATQLSGARRSSAVDEGDARYLPPELLNDNFDNLDRSDVFSLGASLYELAIGTSLPSHGSDYQALRQGVAPRGAVAASLHALCVAMMSPIPLDRPSAADVLSKLCTL